MDEENISLRHLRALLLMLEFGSPTRVAQILDTSQSAVSKMLARLRRHFKDPLFVRGGQTMRPTSKALELIQPLKELLTSPIMRITRERFNPTGSTREFSIIVTEAGMVHLLLPIIRYLEEVGPGLQLKALALDYRQVEPRLEFWGGRHRNWSFSKGSFHNQKAASLHRHVCQHSAKRTSAIEEACDPRWLYA